MTLNPEFRRNLWLELTPHRLIAMPVILFAIFVLSALIEETDETWGLKSASISAFYAIVYLWGTRRAAASLADEVRGRTWDSQRMSVLGAWTMTWGKFLGGTAFIWYGGLIALIAFVYAESVDTGLATALRLAAAALLTGLLGQVVAFATALVILYKMRPTPRLPVVLCQIFGLSAAAMFEFHVPEASWNFVDTADQVLWYGRPFAVTDFKLIGGALFLAWAIVAAYRLMRVELQHRALPWAWVCFALFLMAYGAGFAYGEVGQARDAGAALWWLAPSFLVAVVMVYGALFAQPKDVVVQRAFLRAVAASDWPRAGFLTPLWLPSLAIMLGVGAALMTQIPGERLYGGEVWIGGGSAYSPYVVLAAMVFVLRDMGLVMLLNLGARRRRADLVGLVYLVLLYLVFAMLVHALEWDRALPFFVPTPKVTPLWTVGPVLAEALLVHGVLIWRWRRLGAAAAPTLHDASF